jgi:hypothetical protein
MVDIDLLYVNLQTEKKHKQVLTRDQRVSKDKIKTLIHNHSQNNNLKWQDILVLKLK